MKHIFFKLVRYGFFGVVSLVTLLALFFAVENFRGKRAWENYKREAMARGQKLDLSAFIPPPVPDDQNFAMTPLLKPLFGKDPTYVEHLNKRLSWPQSKGEKKMPSLGSRAAGKRVNLAEWSEFLGDSDVLHALKRFAPEMEEISAAARRPYSQFPVRYEDGLGMSVSHAGPLVSLAKLFALRAASELAQNRPSEVFEDCRTLLRLADATKGEPTLISVLVRNGILSIAENAIWLGLSTHSWSEEQLAALQSDLQRIDPLQDGLRALHGEMAWFSSGVEKAMGDRGLCEILEQMTSRGPEKKTSLLPNFPRGWFYQNMLSSCRFYEEEVFPAFDLSARRIHPQKLGVDPRPVGAMHLFAHPYSALADLARGAVVRFLPSVAYAQTAVDEGVIACALERHRLVHNEYPENLDALVPQYLSRLPHDVITGEPLHYSRATEGGFLLYSVGWNGADDHGTVATKEKSSQQNITQGDWVWR